MTPRLASMTAGFLLWASAANAEDEMRRVRITETSITEKGELSVAPGLDVQTKGFGFTYVNASGIGVTYTRLTTYGLDEGADVSLDHQYLDFSYTYGDAWLITAGGGFGVGGGATVGLPSEASTSYQFKNARDVFLGPGFSLGFLELYWIHRRNWVVYAADGEQATLRSQHYQLGVGVHF